MSRNELVDAYLAGTINRRAFVRGLTALGVSVGVAASYAVALQPAEAAPGDYYDYDYYDDGALYPAAQRGPIPTGTGSTIRTRSRSTAPTRPFMTRMGMALGMGRRSTTGPIPVQLVGVAVRPGLIPTATASSTPMRRMSTAPTPRSMTRMATGSATATRSTTAPTRCSKWSIR